MHTLDSLRTGGKSIIYGLNGGRHFISRITAMGFTPGTEVTMISRPGHGPVIVYLRDTEVALGRGEAVKITIQENTK